MPESREMTFGEIDRMAHPVAAHSTNVHDSNGNPSGGHVEFKVHPAFRGKGTGAFEKQVGFIQWQDGPIDYKKSVPNGMTIEALLEACVERLKFYQDSKFSCRENALALTKLEESLHWLDARREDRFRRGVLGKHEV